MECSGDKFFIPTCMTPGTDDTPNPLMREKKLCIEKHITYYQ